jgi:two-component system cell cycle sensor histidine kinase/response regulator CckA
MTTDETVELLAGGIAHDFDALLGAIVGHADNLSDYLSPADPRAAEVAAIRHAAETASALTRQLLAFSRTQPLRPRIVDLDAIVQRSRHALQRLLGTRVRLETQFEAQLPRVRVDGEQIEQILCTLAVNARDAMPEGGVLTIATAAAHLPEEQARQSNVEPGAYVELSVTDNGIGMAPAMQAQLFEPFFTTKPRARGTGLGLAMARGVVRQSGGCIRVESEVGRGSRFVMYLPAVDAAEQAESPQPASASVLVLADDPSVQSFIGDVLRRRGYEVLLAHDRWHALRLADTHQRPIDLLITTRSSGAAVAHALCARHPSTRVLYVWAAEEDASPRPITGDAYPAILQKPFSPAALAGKVRALLQP